MTALLREFRDAWRRLARRPGYTALSVAVLGVGLGVVVFLFGAVNSMILQPYPLPHAERLMTVGDVQSWGVGRIDSDQYLALRGKLHGFDAIGAMQPTRVNLDSGGGATYYRGVRMSASLMKMLGATPLLGRGLQPADDAPGAERVVVLGKALWQQRFAADPAILGRAIRVDGRWASVVGVLQADFAFPPATSLWLPLQLEAGQHQHIGMIGRLAPDMQLGQARAELDALAAGLARLLPAGQSAKPLGMEPLSYSFTARDTRHWVWLMFGAALLVLLLACINVANLQLVQTLTRRRELALRSALGSSRARLIMGALAESLLLSVAALLPAFLITHWGSRWIGATWLAVHPTAVPYERGIDAWVVTFALVVALLSTALAGGIPAWRASRTNLGGALREGSKGSGGRFAQVAKALVVAEVALTLVLLVGAGSFVRTLGRLMTQPLVGTAHAAQVVTAEVSLPAWMYPKDAQRITFFSGVVDHLRQDPAVLAADAANTVPGARLGSHEQVSLPGQPQPPEGWPQVQMGIVGPQFLDIYGIDLLEGRFFDARDRADSTPAVVIDLRMAQAMWPHEAALGRTVLLYPGTAWAKGATVIGVVQTLQLDSALERRLPGMLMPLAQAAGATPLHDVGLAVRMRTESAEAVRHLAAAVHAVDPQAAVYGVHTQAWDVAASRVGLTVLTSVFGALGVVALLLAGAGLYGVLAFAVTQRTREIGIRRAIGAGNGAIVRTVGRQLAWQLGLGIAIGLALALPWSGLLADPGLQTRAYDPAVFVPALLLVVGVSLLAALVPLMRALRVTPTVALRYE